MKETILVMILTVLFLYGINWIITCGIIKLITVCFGLTFSWLTATGIWLIILVLKGIFSHRTNN